VAERRVNSAAAITAIQVVEHTTVFVNAKQRWSVRRRGVGRHERLCVRSGCVQRAVRHGHSKAGEAIGLNRNRPARRAAIA